MIETEKEQLTAWDRKLLTFEMHGRTIKGHYMDVNKKLVQIRVSEDSDGIFQKGDYTNLHKGFLTEYEDEIYIQTEEYYKLNILQKVGGKYYLGYPVAAGIIYGLWRLFTS
jgi:hypothetical protein